MHQSSPVLGYLEKINVNVFDYLPSCFKLTCLECDTETNEKQIGFTNQIIKKNCFGCHKLMTLSLGQ